jgi:hypothetical protein
MPPLYEFQPYKNTWPGTEDFLSNIVMKMDGSQVWNYIRRKLIGIIKLINFMNNFNIRIDFDSEAERLTVYYYYQSMKK